MNKKHVIKANMAMTQNYIKLDGMQTVEVIIVNKRDQHDAYGIVLLADIAKRVLAKDKSPDRINIYEIMSKPVVSVPPEIDVRYCARLFDQFGLSYAPVVEAEEILGLIGYKELILHSF